MLSLYDAWIRRGILTYEKFVTLDFAETPVPIYDPAVVE